MIGRNITFPRGSFFLFGPRGTGKSYWLRNCYRDKSVWLDLLESRVFNSLLAEPQRLDQYIPDEKPPVIIIDEIQKIPALLDEVHRQIEEHGRTFILTGSSPRKLRTAVSNLLAGRALTGYLHPLSAMELGDTFSLGKAVNHGLLPTLYDSEKDVDPERYLASYVETYLREEVLQEGLTRNLAGFNRFLEAASFSQGAVLNISAVSRECSIHRKAAESYFQIIEDLLIAYRIPVFTKKAKRRLVRHPKFYFFDAGVYRAIRPKGPLDTPELIDGVALETVVLQNLQAHNDNFGLGYSLYYWRTTKGSEVDFVLYGPRGLVAIEVKRRGRIDRKDITALKSFCEDYPVAGAAVLYGGDRRLTIDGIAVIPVEEGLRHLDTLL